MALGAQTRDVLRIVVGRGLLLAGLGAAIGIGGAIGLTRLLANELYNVKATDPLTFAAVTLLLMAVALVATLLPARRATRVDPLVALRAE